MYNALIAVKEKKRKESEGFAREDFMKKLYSLDGGNVISDFSPLFSGELAELSFDADFDVAEITEDIKSGSAKACGKAVNRAGYVELTLEISLSIRPLCSRCLEEIDFTKRIVKTLPVCMSLSGDNKDDEYIVIENCMLDVGALCRELIILELPYRYLCSDGCKGLCSECGADLNKGDCGCMKKDIDPRLSKLKDFFAK